MQCFSCVEIFYSQFWHLLHFHLDFKSDIIPQHAEGVIWPLCVWKPFKACCGIFWKSVGVTWKWEAFFSLSCAAKAIHLDKSFSVVLSFKIIFPLKQEQHSLPVGWVLKHMSLFKQFSCDVILIPLEQSMPISQCHHFFQCIHETAQGTI